MDLYFYEGPVTSFGVTINRFWRGRTVAASPAKAMSNLAFHYKMTHQLTRDYKIELPGKLTRGDEI